MASAAAPEPGASILRKTSNFPRDQQSEDEPLLAASGGPRQPRRVSYGVSTTVSVSSESGSGDDRCTTDEDEDTSSTNSFGLNAQQWKTLVTILAATLTSSFAVCLFPPFFPRLAEEKGCNAATYGFIIGTNCLTSFIVTPFIGKNVSKSSIQSKTKRKGGSLGLNFFLYSSYLNLEFSIQWLVASSLVESVAPCLGKTEFTFCVVDNFPLTTLH